MSGFPTVAKSQQVMWASYSEPTRTKKPFSFKTIKTNSNQKEMLNEASCKAAV